LAVSLTVPKDNAVVVVTKGNGLIGASVTAFSKANPAASLKLKDLVLGNVKNPKLFSAFKWSEEEQAWVRVKETTAIAGRVSALASKISTASYVLSSFAMASMALIELGSTVGGAAPTVGGLLATLVNMGVSCTTAAGLLMSGAGTLASAPALVACASSGLAFLADLGAMLSLEGNEHTIVTLEDVRSLYGIASNYVKYALPHSPWALDAVKVAGVPPSAGKVYTLSRPLTPEEVKKIVLGSGVKEAIVKEVVAEIKKSETLKGPVKKLIIELSRDKDVKAAL